MTTQTVDTTAAQLTVAAFAEWMIGAGRTDPVTSQRAFPAQPGGRFNLKNKKTHRFLQHEHQTFGINLGWTDRADPDTATAVSRWFFTGQGAPSKPITYGEVIAPGNGEQPSFIHYAERTVGVNLDWSTSPHFEWVFLGGEPGEPVKAGDWLAIYNVKAESGHGQGEFFIYFDRSVGGDIGWPSSTTWRTKLEQAAVGLAEDAAREAVRALVAG
jgi:hypothetical protein